MRAIPILILAILYLVPGGAALCEPRGIEQAGTWPESSAEAQGMKSGELAAMLASLVEDNPGVRSITVVRGGELVLDVSLMPTEAEGGHDIHSCTKSVMSALIGIAIERGELPGVDTPLLGLLPNREFPALDAAKRAITLEDLLTMTAGLDTRDSYLHAWKGLRRMNESGDKVAYILGLPLAAKPGSRFEYSNCVSELLAIILQDAVQMSLLDYAKIHLFGPLGITDVKWEGSYPGDSWGYSGLNMRPRDMARLGYLFLLGGEWNGRQVVPADWVAASTRSRTQAGTLADSYGYQWWVEDGLFAMQGYGGQFVYVAPELDLVVVFTGALWQQRFFSPRRYLSDYIIPAVVSDEPMPANPAAAARLDDLTRKLESQPEAVSPRLPPLAAEVSGRTYLFEPNKIGLEHVSLHFTESASVAKLHFTVGPAELSIDIGLDGRWRYSNIHGQRWACRGEWSSDAVFVLHQEVLGKVRRQRATLTYDGDSLSFEVHDLVQGSVDVFSGKH